MIELTPDQAQTAEQTKGIVPVVDPRTNDKYVLMRWEVYERMKEPYDDSPWTPEEADALAWEAGKSIGWDDMDKYDHYPQSNDP